MHTGENHFHVNGVAVEIGEGTILDSILEAGYSLPYSCLTGRCLNCGTRLVSGTAEHIGDGNLCSVSDETILTCQHRAHAGLKLYSGRFDSMRLPSKRNLPARIVARRIIDYDYCCLTLALPPNKLLEIVPGQYIDLIRDGCRRSYSVAEVDATQNSLMLILSRVEGGQMSDYIFGTAAVGDRVRIVGPIGAFYLRQPSLARECVFIASGSGIAPIRFMVDAALETNPNFRYRVMWQMREENALTREILAKLGAHAQLVLSRPASKWEGLRGYVQDYLETGTGAAARDYYLCGNPQMVDTLSTRLQDAGVLENSIYSDPFLPAES